MSELRYQNLTVDWAPACRRLELAVFDHANPEELIGENDFEAYARVFPEGFFLCIVNNSSSQEIEILTQRFSLPTATI